jgi:protein-S-isoprenylcysteine O-methyltransferase Ste14
MARVERHGNNERMKSTLSFRERGGWWVAAQALMLAVAALLPLLTRPAVIDDPTDPLRLGGALLLLGGLALAVAAMYTLGPLLTPYPRPLREGEFCTNGPYVFMRHPIYTGVIVAALGWAILWQSWPGVAFAPVLFIFLDRKAAYEEHWLVRTHADYAAYAARVRKFFPGVY